jgi:formylglycine-generating enzyme required for sulfatase activity
MTTERGAYTLDGTITGGLTINRETGAKFWIPSEDEWYKAAYHQPAGQGGDADSYWLYPTKSNVEPGNTTGAVPLANQANFKTAVYSVTESGIFSASQNYLTEAGSSPGSAGFYGTFDQGGNVFEWSDVVYGGPYRGFRGRLVGPLRHLPQCRQPVQHRPRIGDQLPRFPRGKSLN